MLIFERDNIDIYSNSSRNVDLPFEIKIYKTNLVILFIGIMVQAVSAAWKD